MNAKIIGFKNVDFTPEGGERIIGTNVYLALYRQSDVNRVGGVARKFWQKPEQMDAIMKAAGLQNQRDALDCSANAEFDEDGKLTGLVILPPETLADAAKRPKSVDALAAGK